MCVFCKIINKEIPCYKVYEDENFLAFLDLCQSSIGHTLVIPKKHYNDIFELDEQTSNQIFSLVTRLAKAVKDETKAEGINILNNNGEAAGQSVKHFHIHIIPRYKDDNIVFKFSENKLSKEEFISLSKRINNRI